MAKTRRDASPTFTLEEKLALVTQIDRLYRTGSVSLSQAAEVAGTSATSYRNWVRSGIKPREPEPKQAAAPGPYSRVERQHLVAEIERLRDAGQSVKAACLAVGVSGKSYHKWRGAVTPGPAMVPVEITALVPLAPPPAFTPAPASPPAGELTLVAPSGYRIEGLAVESAAALLRLLPC